MPVIRDEFVCALIQRAKEKSGIASDAKIADAVGVSRTAVGAWQSGRNYPDVEQVVALCKLAGEDPAPAVLYVERARSGNDETRQFWDALAARLQAPVARIAALFAIVFLAGMLVPQPAPAAPLHVSSDSIVYALSLLTVLLCRLGVRLRRSGIGSPSH